MIELLPSTFNNVLAHWEYTNNWIIPLKPKFSISCPICGGDTRFKQHNLHYREFKITGKQPRLDMTYKCIQCSYIMNFGVHITETYYNNITKQLLSIVGRVRTLHILEAIDIERLNK